MQATNDVISVGICSVVAALLFAQQPERERTVKEQEMSGGGVGRGGRVVANGSRLGYGS